MTSGKNLLSTVLATVLLAAAVPVAHASGPGAGPNGPVVPHVGAAGPDQISVPALQTTGRTPSTAGISSV